MAGSRFTGTTPVSTAEGWTCTRITQPSRLFGANGIRTAPDGRIYVAQVPGSAVTALDPDTGAAEFIAAIDGPITAPDDIAFDSAGNMYATELTIGRVSMLTPKGEYRVIDDDMEVANPITIHQDRLFAGECRVGGRIFELDRNGGPRRTILEGAPMPNAFEIGPDGMLYAPMMATNEIWRIDPATGTHEVVAGDLGVPDSVKFDSKGRIVSTQVASGQVLRIDPQPGQREVLAQLGPGLDNCTFVGERLFVSSIPGDVYEILADQQVRPLVAHGLQWPMGLALSPEGGLFVADGGFDYMLGAGGSLDIVGFLFSPGFPGFTRGVAASGPGEWVVTNSMGMVMRWRPGDGTSEPVSTGHEVLYGVAVAPDGTVVFADGEGGKVHVAANGNVEELASGLDMPMGVAVGEDGAVYASEAGAGRVLKLAAGRSETVIDGLVEPQGIAVQGDTLLIVDAEAKELVSCNLFSGAREVLAGNLPVKAPRGVQPKRLGAVGDMSGPMHPFCGIAVAGDGTIYLAGDAEGSVLAIRRSS